MSKQTIKNAARRTLSLVLCLCMAFSGLALPAYAAEGGTEMELKDTEWYSDGRTDPKMKILVSHYYSDGSSYDDEPVDFTGPGDSESFPRNDTMPNSEEWVLSGLSVTAGQNATRYLEGDSEKPDDDRIEVTYNSDVHVVKIDAFYKPSTQALGKDFGTSGEDADPEEDTRIATTADQEADTDNVGIVANETKLYNTAEGLHTDKTATAQDDGRTFNVTLESWFAGQNKADVGMILDASGSMAFASDEDSLQRLYVNEKPIDDVIKFNGEGSASSANASSVQFEGEDVDGRIWLRNETVKNLLYSDYTDNSARIL